MQGFLSAFDFLLSEVEVKWVDVSDLSWQEEEIVR
jgi:hypothetical protein